MRCIRPVRQKLACTVTEDGQRLAFSESDSREMPDGTLYVTKTKTQISSFSHMQKVANILKHGLLLQTLSVPWPG